MEMLLSTPTQVTPGYDFMQIESAGEILASARMIFLTEAPQGTWLLLRAASNPRSLV
jgi:hypothetical protein